MNFYDYMEDTIVLKIFKTFYAVHFQATLQIHSKMLEILASIIGHLYSFDVQLFLPSKCFHCLGIIIFGIKGWVFMQFLTTFQLKFTRI